MKTVISSSNAPKAIGPYSQAIAVSQGKTIYLSGQIPIDLSVGDITALDIQSQTKQVILNLNNILKEAGGSLSNIVKTTVFLTDMSEFSAMNEIYASFFKDECPARSTIEVCKLPKNAKIEIEAIAVI